MKQTRKAFTLVELLIVIAIIGLLSAITFITLNRAREKANIAKAQIETRQIGLAIMFLGEDTGHWPAHSNRPLPCASTTESDPGLVSGEAWEYEPNEGFNVEIYSVPKSSCPYMNLLHPWFGLTGSDARNANQYVGWNGPYLPNTITKDPWGNAYVLDGDYVNTAFGITNTVAVVSGGANGITATDGFPQTDDVFYKVCRYPSVDCKP